VFENIIWGRIFGLNRVEATVDIENCTIKSLVLFTKYFSLINVINQVG
jgi:hypothetical protein